MRIAEITGQFVNRVGRIVCRPRGANEAANDDVATAVGRVSDGEVQANDTANAPNRPRTSTERWHKHKANDPDLFNAKRRERDRLRRERERTERVGNAEERYYVTTDGLRYFAAMAEELAAMKAEKASTEAKATEGQSDGPVSSVVSLRQRA